MNKVVRIIVAAICMIMAGCGKKSGSESKAMLDSIARPSLEVGSFSSFSQEANQDSAKSDSGLDTTASLVEQDTVARIEPIKQNEPKSTYVKTAIVSKSLSKPSVKRTVAKDVSQVYEGLRARSERYYRKSLELLGTQNDSALYYATEAIRLFENGSIFRVKAQALYNLGAYTNAAIACDVCGERNDHWDVSDIEKCEHIKCESLRKVYEKYPSTESKARYESACSVSDNSRQ